MNDQELSRMVSLENIAQRYADEADALKTTLAACNEVAAAYKLELDRFRKREPLVRAVFTAVVGNADSYYNTEFSPAAIQAMRDSLRITGASEDASSADDLTVSDQAAALKSLEKASAER